MRYHLALSWACALGVIGLTTQADASSTSSRFGLLPSEIGHLQTPNNHGTQLFSSPVAVADQTRTNIKIFATARHWQDSPTEPTAYLGAAIFVPFVPPTETALGEWFRGRHRQPNLWTLSRRGSTEPRQLSPQSAESLDLRTTLNSRPHPRLNLALGLRSLAKLVGTIDVRVADEGNETYVINRLLTSFRPELEARWRGHGWSVQSGYRHRLLVDYDVPLRAALEDPVPLDLPELAIRGVAFIEPSALWLGGSQHQDSRSWAWRVQIEFADSQSVGLSGLTPTEVRPLPQTGRRLSAALSNQARLVPKIIGL